MSSLLKNLVIALVLSIVIGSIYYALVGDEVADEAGTGTALVSSDVIAQTAKILADTKRIDEYDLDISIFNDPRFVSLKDYHVDIADTQTGRTNPFAAVGQ